MKPENWITYCNKLLVMQQIYITDTNCKIQTCDLHFKIIKWISCNLCTNLPSTFFHKLKFKLFESTNSFIFNFFPYRDIGNSKVQFPFETTKLQMRNEIKLNKNHGRRYFYREYKIPAKVGKKAHIIYIYIYLYGKIVCVYKKHCGYKNHDWMTAL